MGTVSSRDDGQIVGPATPSPLNPLRGMRHWLQVDKESEAEAEGELTLPVKTTIMAPVMTPRRRNKSRHECNYLQPIVLSLYDETPDDSDLVIGNRLKINGDRQLNRDRHSITAQRGPDLSSP